MTSAAILIGGRATRFGGRDKGALVINGRSILERQLSELARVTDDVLLVGREIEPPIPGVRAIRDRLPDAGPLGGLDAAFAAARFEAVLLLACDLPFVTAPFLQYLVDRSAEADAVVPRTKRGYHPLCAVYASTCRSPVAERLARRQLKMLDLLKDIRVRSVGQDEIGQFGDAERLLANVNTPTEFDELEALHGHKL